MSDDAICEARFLGKRDAMRGLVTWLGKRAASMNDPHAKAILNSAAFDLGCEIRDAARAKAEPQPSAISPQSPEYLESCLRQFGPSQDGTVERDLAAAKAELQPSASMMERARTLLASDYQPHQCNACGGVYPNPECRHLRNSRELKAIAPCEPVGDTDLCAIIALALARARREALEEACAAAIWAVHDASLPSDEEGRNYERRRIMAAAIQQAIRALIPN